MGYYLNHRLKNVKSTSGMWEVQGGWKQPLEEQWVLTSHW